MQPLLGGPAEQERMSPLACSASRITGGLPVAGPRKWRWMSLKPLPKPLSRLRWAGRAWLA